MADVTGVVVAAVAVVAACVAGALWRARDGRVRSEKPSRGTPSADAAPATATILRSLGATAGQGVTLVQFSSPVCAPCRATHAMCSDIAARTPSVTHVEVDASTHLDEVRSLDIWRTPTVLIVAGDGSIRHRVSGLPDRAGLLAAIADARTGPAEPDPAGTGPTVTGPTVTGPAATRSGA